MSTHIYRTQAQKFVAQKTAYRHEGTWRSDAPFSIHGRHGEFIWNAARTAILIKFIDPKFR